MIINELLRKLWKEMNNDKLFDKMKLKNPSLRPFVQLQNFN